MKVYLINKLDRYCPENNNGDWIIEVWGDPEKAVDRADVLDKEDNYWKHSVITHDVEGIE